MFSQYSRPTPFTLSAAAVVRPAWTGGASLEPGDPMASVATLRFPR